MQLKHSFVGHWETGVPIQNEQIKKQSHKTTTLQITLSNHVKLALSECGQKRGSGVEQKPKLKLNVISIEKAYFVDIYDDFVKSGHCF